MAWFRRKTTTPKTLPSKPAAKLEWFRRATWSEEDQADFFAHLGRSRPYNRAQYLRIQALHLQRTGEPALIEVALELLEKLFADHPEARGQKVSSLSQKAACLVLLRRYSQAAATYDQLFEAQRENMNFRVQMIDYARFVLDQKIKERYEHALSIVREFTLNDSGFPVISFGENACQALLLDRLGRADEAGPYAQAALAAAARTESAYRYHRKLGLVGDVPKDESKRLIKLAR